MKLLSLLRLIPFIVWKSGAGTGEHLSGLERQIGKSLLIILYNIADTILLSQIWCLNIVTITAMLTFITTMSLDDFKEIKKADAVEIKQNPLTGKTFFICGDATGAVSRKFTTDEGKEAVVSEVEGEDGDTFFLLHNRVNGTQSIISL